MDLAATQASFEPQRSVLCLPEHLLGFVRDQVEQRRLNLHFSHTELEQRYMTQRAIEYGDLVRLGWPLLLIVCLMIFGMSVQFYPDDMFAHHGLLLWGVWLPLFLSLLVGIFVPTRPRWIVSFERIVTGCGLMVLTLLLTVYFFAQNNDFFDHAGLNITLLLLIMAFASRIRVWMFAGMLGAASSIALLIAWIGHAQISWLKFGHLMVLYAGTILFVMAFVEAHHRLAFLQSLLFNEQAQLLQNLQHKLEMSAREDLLSGLPNRRSFDEIFRREWDRTRRDQQEISLLYLDVDYFNLYNENYGLVAGDAVLQKIAQVLRDSLLRPADQACRYSGESFVLILPNTNTQGAVEVAGRIIASVDRLAVEHRWSQVASHITVSIGVASSTCDETENLELLIRADDALYQAKRAGRHRVFVNG